MIFEKKIIIAIYHQNGKKNHFENHQLYQKLTTRCQKIGKSASNHIWKILTNVGDHLSITLTNFRLKCAIIITS